MPKRFCSANLKNGIQPQSFKYLTHKIRCNSGNSSLIFLAIEQRQHLRVIVHKTLQPVFERIGNLLPPRKHRLLRLPIQWHHPAQHALQIDRHIGIGEQIVHNHWAQQCQAQEAPDLRYIDAFGSGNISFARIGTTLPATRGRAQ